MNKIILEIFSLMKYTENNLKCLFLRCCCWYYFSWKQQDIHFNENLITFTSLSFLHAAVWSTKAINHSVRLMNSLWNGIFNSFNCSIWMELISCHGFRAITSVVESIQNISGGGSSIHFVWCFGVYNLYVPLTGRSISNNSASLSPQPSIFWVNYSVSLASVRSRFKKNVSIH